MILSLKSGCLASGRVTRSGGELTFIGDRRTPKYKFSVQVENRKDENGEWKSRFLDCELFGKDAEAAPEIHGGDLVFCTGRLENRTWTGGDGKPRSAVSLKCDFVAVASSGRRADAEEAGAAARPVGRGVDVYQDAGEFAEMGEEDGELPF